MCTYHCLAFLVISYKVTLLLVFSFCHQAHPFCTCQRLSLPLRTCPCPVSTCLLLWMFSHCPLKQCLISLHRPAFHLPLLCHSTTQPCTPARNLCNHTQLQIAHLMYIILPSQFYYGQVNGRVVLFKLHNPCLRLLLQLHLQPCCSPPL